MTLSRKMKNASFRGSLALLVLGFSVWLIWPAQALARALVRFIHAIPDVGAVTVVIDSGGVKHREGVVDFAQITPWRSLRAGGFRWALIRNNTALASGSATVGNGAYDMVLLSKSPSGVSLRIYKDRPGKPGVSLLRVIHAAPQLGSPALQLDSHIFRSSIKFSQATPYRTALPGVHSLSAVKLGDPAPLVSVQNLRLTPGASYSALLLGSAGQRLRWVTVTDRGAPLTRPARHITAGSHLRSESGLPDGGSVVVHRGDSLWTIAARHLGSGATNEAIAEAVKAIWQLNKGRIGTDDPSLIFPGQRITFPT